MGPSPRNLPHEFRSNSYALNGGKPRLARPTAPAVDKQPLILFSEASFMNALSNVNVPKDTATDGVALTARIVMSMMFITSGFGKLMGFAGTVDHIAEKGVPLAEIAAVIA